MTVAYIVYSDPLYACKCASPLHLMEKKMLGYREDPLITLNAVQELQIFLHFFTKEIRHRDRAVAVSRFRGCDQILSVELLIGL